MSAALPVGLADQVAAARDDLAALMPRLRAIIDTYNDAEATFNRLVPKGGSDEDWQQPWRELGCEEIEDHLLELLYEIGDAVGRRVL